MVTVPGLCTQLMNSGGEGQLDLRQLAWLLGLLTRSDLPGRLKLFYCLHLPPLLDQMDMDSPLSGQLTLDPSQRNYGTSTEL